MASIPMGCMLMAMSGQMLCYIDTHLSGVGWNTSTVSKLIRMGNPFLFQLNDHSHACSNLHALSSSHTMSLFSSKTIQDRIIGDMVVQMAPQDPRVIDNP
jgi:hypothetical protein